MNFKGGIFILFHILLLFITQSKSWQVINYVPPFHFTENQHLLKDNTILNIPNLSEPPIKHEGFTDNEEPQLLSVLPKNYETTNSQNIGPENNETWATLSYNNDVSKQKHFNPSNNNNNVNKKYNNLNPETQFLQQVLELLNSNQNNFDLNSEQNPHKKINSNIKIPVLSESSEKKKGLIDNKEPESLSVVPRNHDAIKKISLIENVATPFKKENSSYVAQNTNNKPSSSYLKSIKIYPQNTSPLNNETNHLSSDNNTDNKRIHLNPNNNNDKVNIKFSNSESDILTKLLQLINSRQNSLVLQESKEKSKLNGTQSHDFNEGNKPVEKNSKQIFGYKQETTAQNVKTFKETLTTTEKSDIIKNNTEYLKDSKSKNLQTLQNKVKAKLNQVQKGNQDYLEEITKLFNQQNALSQKTNNLDQQYDSESLKQIKGFFVQSENGTESNESVDLDQAFRREPKNLKMLVDLLRIPKEYNVQKRPNVERKKESQNQPHSYNLNYNNDNQIKLEKIQRLYSTLQQRKDEGNSYFNKLRYINQMRNSPLLSPLNAVSTLQARLLHPQNLTYPNTHHFEKYQAPFRQANFKQPNYSQQISADQQTSEDFPDVLSNLNINNDFRGFGSHPSYECELGSISRIGCHKCICSPERKFLCDNKPDCKLSDEIKADNV